MRRVRLFHWNPKDAEALIAKLRAAGFDVVHHAESQSPSVRELKESGAVAVVVDLSRLPSHGRYVGAWVRGSKSTRHIPLVFVGGDVEKVAAIKKQMPDAVYSSIAGVGAALTKAIKNPVKEPVVPRQMMETAPGRTPIAAARPPLLLPVFSSPRSIILTSSMAPTFQDGVTFPKSRTKINYEYRKYA